VALTLASAAWLAGLEVTPPRSFVRSFMLGLAVTVPLHAGLFWAPSARGWQRLVAAALMVPCTLIYFSFVGQQVMRVVRGYPLGLTSTITFVGGAVVYTWQLVALAWRAWGAWGAKGADVNA